MEISNEDAEALLSNPRNGGPLFSRSIISEKEVTYEPLHKGTRNGGREVPPLMRELIGVSAHRDTLANTAGAFDVSVSTVAQAKKGNVGVSRHDPDLAGRIQTQVGKDAKAVKDLALERLAGMFASAITQEKLDAIPKVREAVTVARELAGIASSLTEKKEGGNVAVFIQYPRIKDEKEYDAVDLIHIPDKKKVD